MNLYSTVGIIAGLLININGFWIPDQPVRKLIKRTAIVTNDLMRNATSNSVIQDTFLLSDPATATGPSTETIPGNNLLIGQCSARDQRVYTDDTVVENSGPSTLSGTLEVSSGDYYRCVSPKTTLYTADLH